MKTNNSTSIYDVAQEAKVSIATVSRALNNSASVSPATKEKVMEALSKLNYQPNSIARALVSKRMNTIGILTVDIRSVSYAETAYTIERQLSDHGYNSILCNTFGSKEDNIFYVRMLLDKGVSGIICIGSVFDKTFNESNILEEFNNIPFIMTNHIIEAKNVSSVVIDEKSAIEKSLDYLFSNGHRSIVYIRDMDTYSANQKETAFEKHLTQMGIEDAEKRVFVTTRSLEGGREVAQEIIDSSLGVTAILANDDITAVGCMKKLMELGYRIPEDISIIGYNNTILSECADPRLTTVDNKFSTMGRLAASLLIDMIESDSLASSVSIIPELIIRDSVRSIASNATSKQQAPLSHASEKEQYDK